MKNLRKSCLRHFLAAYHRWFKHSCPKIKFADFTEVFADFYILLNVKSDISNQQFKIFEIDKRHYSMSR